MRTIIYGDIHGCLEEFKELRLKVNPLDSDQEIVIGDILDRGPHSNELLKYIRKNKISSILGNHEYKYIRYKKHQDNFIKHNVKNPILLDDNKLNIFNNLSNEDFEYLQFLPLYLKIGNLTLIHAGITNKINLLDANKKELENTLWIRMLDENQNPLSLEKTNQINAKFWTEYYDGSQGVIVYGHNVFDDVKVDKYSIGIDTGCVYGNKLTALILNDTERPFSNYEIVQVESKRKYSESEYKTSF